MRRSFGGVDRRFYCSLAPSAPFGKRQQLTAYALASQVRVDRELADDPNSRPTVPITARLAFARGAEHQSPYHLIAGETEITLLAS